MGVFGLALVVWVDAGPFSFELEPAGFVTMSRFPFGSAQGLSFSVFFHRYLVVVVGFLAGFGVSVLVWGLLDKHAPLT